MIATPYMYSIVRRRTADLEWSKHIAKCNNYPWRLLNIITVWVGFCHLHWKENALMNQCMFCILRYNILACRFLIASAGVKAHCDLLVAISTISGVDLKGTSTLCQIVCAARTSRLLAYVCTGIIADKSVYANYMRSESEQPSSVPRPPCVALQTPRERYRNQG